ncbi:MAG: class I SAM-dependent methyltransferase [Candidatus Parcubacteria bacterium]|nr:class I SAM-dependent methyltransferase [Candidatus Parcubacteria bacterium]
MSESGGLQFLDPKEVLDKVGLIQGMKVADLGCGNLGHFIIPAARIVGKDGLAYAVDIQSSVLDSVKHRAAREALNNLNTVRSNLEIVGSTPIPAASLDVVFLINVLFQNSQHSNMVTEAARLVKKGGKLVIIDWKKIGVPFGPAVEKRIDPQIIIKYATAEGLNLQLQTEFGKYFWGLIFEKI